MLAPGGSIGPYRVVSKIGEGGMGEVFQAHDPRLGRDVALKVSGEAFTDRFAREARSIAALNHTNICHLYDVGPDYLVMEFVEGEDLAKQIAAQRAKGSGLSLDEALPIINQLIDGIEAAHERGIVHRDLKPANIKVTPDGVVKILDFGLAKAMVLEGTGSAGDLTNSPTIGPGLNATMQGTILGTAAYMAPEQARGKQADRRADIWAFGVIVYELLTGKQLFEGETAVEVLGQVLHKTPDLSAAPLRLRKLLEWCLEKDRKDRLQAIGDARRLLREMPVATPAAPAPVSASRVWGQRAGWVVAVLALGALGTRQWLARSSGVEPETRLEISTPPGRLSFSKISPDGRKVVFAAARDGKRQQLWLRPLASEVAQPLAGTEGAEYPFWSPDSRSIAFVAAGKLMRVDLAGGSPRPLAEAPNIISGAWGPDGTILFSLTGTSPLSRLPATGGSPVDASRLSGPVQAAHRYPNFLPDGRHFLFFVAGTAGVQGIYVGSLDNMETHLLLQSESAGVFAIPDFVLFARQGNLVAQRIDLKTLQTSGEALLVAEQVSFGGSTVGEVAVSTSQTGLIAYRAPASDPRQLTWFDRTGREEGTLGAADDSMGGSVHGFRISPDGRVVATVRLTQGNSDVWLMDTARALLRPFTSSPSIENRPVWSPDGGRVAFMSRRSGPQGLWVKRTDGGAEEPLHKSAENEVPLDWSRDGRFILFLVDTRDLWALPLDGDKKLIPVATTNAIEDEGRFSPDGGSVVYQSNETGRPEIYVTPFPGPGVPMPVSTSGGVNPWWRDDGREILYLGLDNRLMAVPVTPRANGGQEFGTPVPLFSIPPGTPYDIAQDGRRILMAKPVGQVTTPPITIIQNWHPASK